MNISTKQIKYRHLRPTHAGRATVAFTSVKNEDNGTITFIAGISYCSPLDQYVKHYGRDKARGRLLQIAGAADGWMFATRDPEKYQIVTVEDTENNTEKDFIKALDTIVSDFLPRAVAKQEALERLRRLRAA